MTSQPTISGKRSLSSIFLGISNISETLLPLARGMVLARLLPPDQFGIAITITVVASIAELISELGVSQMAIRTGVSDALGTLHSLAVLRGLLLGCAISVSGPLFAMLFHTPSSSLMYVVAGIASIVAGWTHLEPKARMKRYDYLGEALVTLSRQVIWTVTSIGVAFIIPDYRAMIFGLLASAIGGTVASHLLASSAFRLKWSRDIVSESFTYGRPLILNGIVLSVTNLGDRFLVGSRFGLGPLAEYNALVSAAFLPRSAITRFLTSLFTPQFVNATTVDEQRRLANTWIVTLSILGGGFGLSFIAIGQELVRLAFGSKYFIRQDLITLIAFLACVRYLGATVLPPAMAAGRTKMVLLNTVSSVAGLAIGATLLLVYPTLETLIGSMIVGEGLALLFVLSRLTSFVRFTRSILWTAVAVPNLMIAGMTAVLFVDPQLSAEARIVSCLTLIAALILCCDWLLRMSGSSLTDLLHRLFPRFHGLASEA